MFKPHVPASGQYYGYGWRVTELTIGDKKKRIVWHSGGGISIIYRSIEDGYLVLLINNMNLLDRRLEICRQLMNILYNQPYTLPKKSIAAVLLKTIFHKGAESAIRLYHDLKANHAPEYSFGEIELNLLGYELLRQNEVKEAIEIFKLNVKAYPQAWNVYDSLGEAYVRKGDKKSAIENYKKAMELNPKRTIREKNQYNEQKKILKVLKKGT
jgi:tetratricopeptide (TPR) repeat protein